MSIPKNIQNATFFIDKLKQDLPKISSKKQRDFTIDMLNSFIVLINTVELLASKNIGVNAVEQLLLSRLYSQIYQSVAEGKQIDMKLVCRNIDNDLKHDKTFAVDKIVELLRSHELTMLVDQNQLTTETLTSITAVSEYRKMVTDLLNQFKNQLAWN